MTPREAASKRKPASAEPAEPAKSGKPAAPTAPAEDGPRPVPASRNALAAGAARASGERRRRSGTPLLSAPEALEVSVARRDTRAERSSTPEPASEPTAGPAPEAVVPTAPGRVARRRVQQEAAPGQADGSTAGTAAGSDSRETAGDTANTADPAGTTGPARSRPSRNAIRDAGSQARAAARSQARLHAVPDAAAEPAADLGGGEEEPAQRHTGSFLDAAEFSSRAVPGPAEFVELAINVLRSAALAAGIPAEEVERRVAETLAYVRRRLTGDYTVDEFGFDQDWTDNVHLPLLRPLYQKWFRVEVKGIENIPAEGGALVVANHSGTVAIDGLMTQLAVHDEHPAHRHLRMLGADLVFQTPFVGTIARRSGATLASNHDAERLLSAGHLVGVYPEGFKGVGKPYSERYKLQRFGRGGFVSAALRAGVPIIPCSIVGAEEIYPIIGNMPTVARLLGLPYAPITPTFPLLGPLGLIPLPSKWLIEFGPPIDTASFGPEAAEDPMLVFDLTDQVRETIQQTLYSLLMQRQSVFI